MISALAAPAVPSRSTDVASTELATTIPDAPPTERGDARTDRVAPAAGPKDVLDDRTRASALFASQEDEGPDGLTEAERREVERMRTRDRQVREHEMAHVTAAGPYASQPSFRSVRGPDGRFYAVGGEVRIDTSPVPGNPEATIRKMQAVKRAALAPREPSAQDQRVAAHAEGAIIRARQELSEQKREEQAKRAEQETARHGVGGIDRSVEKPAFDAESRFRVPNRGIGPLPGPDLAGTGGIDVEVTGTLEAGALFNLVA